MRIYHYEVTIKTHRHAEAQIKKVKAASATSARMKAFESLNAYEVSAINRIKKHNKK